MPKTIIFIRHGETGQAKLGRFFGGTNLPLSEEGLLQARRLKPWLAARITPEPGCYASPMRRVLETAGEAWPGMQPELDSDLREMHFGDCEGLTYAEIAARYPETAEDWNTFAPRLHFPNGERLADYLERVQRAANRLAGDPRGHLVVFSHGGAIRMLVCHFLGIPFAQYSVFDLPCAGVGVVRIAEGRGVLAGWGGIA